MAPNTQEQELSPERKQRVRETLNDSFRDPRILQRFDAILTRRALIEANRGDEAAFPLAPVPAANTPGAARNYALSHERRGQNTANYFPNVATAEGNETEIHRAFRSLNVELDGWLQAYPDNERNVMRERFYYLIHEEVQTVLSHHTTEYERKQRELSQAGREVYNTLNLMRDTVATNLNVVGNGQCVGPPAWGPVDVNPGTAPVVGAFNALANNLSLEMVMGQARIPALGITITNAAQLQNFRQQYLNRFNNLVGYLRNPVGTPYVPADNSVSPPRLNDQPKIDAINTIAGMVNNLNAPTNNYESSIRDNLNDHNGNAITSQQLNDRVDLLHTVNANLPRPAVDEIMSRDERYRNVQNEGAQVAAMYGMPYAFYHPINTPALGTGYARGREFSVADYASYMEWARANRETVPDDQKARIDANSAHIMSQLSSSFNAPALLPNLRAQLAAGAITSYQVKSQLRTLVASFFQHRADMMRIDLGTMGVPPFAQNEDQQNAYLEHLRWHFKLGPNANADELVEKVSSEIIGRLNLPSAEEQAEVTNDNRAVYAEREYELRNISSLFSHFGRVAARNQARQNYLESSRAQIYETLRKKYEGQDMHNSEVRNKFTKEMVSLVMQNRLDVINALAAQRQENWFNSVKERLSDIQGVRLLTTLGLAGVAIGSAAFLNPTMFAPLTNAVRTGLSTFFGATIPNFINASGGVGHLLLKGTGIGATFAVGQRVTSDVMRNLAYHMPWSASRFRNRTSIMGTTDAAGNNQGGLGDINRMAGTYDQAPVQNALADQILLAEQYGAKFATKDADGLKLITSEKFKRKFGTADHLIAREKQGMSNVIQYQINNVLTDAAVPADQKNNQAIVNALDALYNPGGMEQTFLTQLEGARTYRKAINVTKFIGSVGVGAGLGNWFRVNV